MVCMVNVSCYAGRCRNDDARPRDWVAAAVAIRKRCHRNCQSLRCLRLLHLSPPTIVPIAHRTPSLDSGLLNPIVLPISMPLWSQCCGSQTTRSAVFYPGFLCDSFVIIPWFFRESFVNLSYFLRDTFVDSWSRMPFWFGVRLWSGLLWPMNHLLGSLLELTLYLGFCLGFLEPYWTKGCTFSMTSSFSAFHSLFFEILQDSFLGILWELVVISLDILSRFYLNSLSLSLSLSLSGLDWEAFVILGTTRDRVWRPLNDILDFFIFRILWISIGILMAFLTSLWVKSCQPTAERSLRDTLDFYVH